MTSRTSRPHNGVKFLLALGLILGSTAYALWQSGFSSAPAASTPVVATPSQTQPAPTQTQPAPVETAPPPQGSTQTGQYADGTYTGSTADAYYGMVQVQAVISGGKLTDVKFLQYPNDRGTSREINTQAMPLLTQEAVAAQSAQVDGVSGATQTSEAFVQSLSAALAKAKA